MVERAGTSVGAIDRAWLHSQFLDGASPAVVAQIVKSGQAPKLQPQVRPISAIDPSDPRAMKFPSDRSEWKIAMSVLAIAIIAPCGYLGWELHVLSVWSRVYPSRQGEGFGYFLGDTWWCYLVVLAAIFFARRFFKYSPYVSWQRDNYVVTVTVLSLIAAFFCG